MVVMSAFLVSRESSRVCWTTIGTSDSNTLAGTLGAQRDGFGIGELVEAKVLCAPRCHRHRIGSRWLTVGPVDG